MSSHVSTFVLILSPHTLEHVQGAVILPPVQLQPLTGPEQSPRQKSIDETSPSSQISPRTFLPSPQIGVHTAGTVVVQVHPVSIVQAEEQPSKSAILPSSHDSETVLFPSPQSSIHTQGFVKSPPEQ